MRELDAITVEYMGVDVPVDLYRKEDCNPNNLDSVLFINRKGVIVSPVVGRYPYKLMYVTPINHGDIQYNFWKFSGARTNSRMPAKEVQDVNNKRAHDLDIIYTINKKELKEKFPEYFL